MTIYDKAKSIARKFVVVSFLSMERLNLAYDDI